MIHMYYKETDISQRLTLTVFICKLKKTSMQAHVHRMAQNCVFMYQLNIVGLL